MFSRISRSWEYAKVSYGIVWEHKHLMFFPLISSIALLLVLASFALPIWQSGLYEQWLTVASEQSGTTRNNEISFTTDALFWVVTFAFYFVNYFVIVFFNSALTACALKAIDGSGEEPTVGYGLGMAMKRIGAISGWAAIAAVVGTILNAIENSNEKAGAIVAGLLGMAWSALTFFVVPILVMDGVGPIEAFKRSTKILKETWGEALVGNFSLGLLGFLVSLPFLAIVIVLGVLAAMSGSTLGIAAAIATGVILLMIVSAFTSAADVVFTALLYNYATGRSTPTMLDESSLRDAFAPKA